jgi:hypothetical protein
VTEHLKWCRERALGAYDFYMAREGVSVASKEARYSMLFDLGLHPETAGFAEAFAASMPEGQDKTRDEVKALVEAVGA